LGELVFGGQEAIFCRAGRQLADEASSSSCPLFHWQVETHVVTRRGGAMIVDSKEGSVQWQ